MTYSQVLAYDPASPSGLRWIVDQPRVGKTAGDVAGGKRPTGYWSVGVFGGRVQAHVIVWELHNGPVPDGYELDHKDRDKGNNLIGNLRCVTHLANMQNVSHHADAAQPVRGLDWHKAGKCWRGRHTIDGVTTTRRSVKREVVEAWLLHVQSLSLKEIECALTSTSLS